MKEQKERQLFVCGINYHCVDCNNSNTNVVYCGRFFYVFVCMYTCKIRVTHNLMIYHEPLVFFPVEITCS